MEIKQVQHYNVTCVTKRYKGSEMRRKAIQWHVPITGVALVVTSYKEELGVKINKTVVCFQEEEHELLYVRSGLNGTMVTIGIDRPDFPFEVWELYTDTPADDSVKCEEEREEGRRRGSEL